MPQAEWRKAIDFAEVAEALRVTTTQILGAMNPHSDTVTVMYSPFESEMERIFSIRLKRDRDGVLQPVSLPMEHVGMWEEMKRRAEIEIPKLIEDDLR